MKTNTIITISRQYGSGGLEIGQKLAQKLGIPCYDRDIITLASKKSGFSEDLFDHLDKRSTNSFLYSLTMFGSAGMNGMTLTDQLFVIQSGIIKELAMKGSCVIVGRCSNHVLRKFPNRYDFFIHGDIDTRVVRAKEEYKISDKHPSAAVEKMDKQRATYYNYYTGKTWGDAKDFDLSINSSRLGVDNCVNLIQDYISVYQSNQ